MNAITPHFLIFCRKKSNTCCSNTKYYISHVTICYLKYDTFLFFPGFQTHIFNIYIYRKEFVHYKLDKNETFPLTFYLNLLSLWK